MIIDPNIGEKALRMRNTFADLVETVAEFQYQSEHLIETLDGYIQEAKEFKDVDEHERETLLKTLYQLRPIIIQSLSCKAIISSLKL